MVNGVSDIKEVLPELAGYVFICRILFGQLHGDGKHVEAVHSHPAGSVRLFDVATGWKRSASIEDADVVQSEKPALEDIAAFAVLPIDPPCEIEKQFLKHAREEGAVTGTSALFIDLVNAPCGPCMDGWIHVAECPLIRRQLPVGMHVPLAQQQNELLLGKFRIHER